MKWEFVWFAGQPVAQLTPGAAPLYTFTDHLGTPILQTDTTHTITWRAEYEPFGNVYLMRAGTRTAQPLRFPGQEVATTWEGAEERYNVFRWYQSGWGRYNQADPISFTDNAIVPLGRLRTGHAVRPYDYVSGRPLSHIDPVGLWGIAPPVPNANTIICDGNGGVAVQIVDQNRCTRGCTVAHEQSHRADAIAANPQICAGQSRGVVPGFTTLEEEIDSERRAYTTSLHCLDELLSRGDNANGCCSDDLRAQRDFLNSYGRTRGYLP